MRFWNSFVPYIAENKYVRLPAELSLEPQALLYMLRAQEAIKDPDSLVLNLLLILYFHWINKKV